MKITKLKLKNFRNHMDTEVDFNEHINYIVGKNAQGKTNLVEPIYIISTLKSFRNSKLVDCINEENDRAEIEASIKSTRCGTKKIRFVINREGENEFYVNENKISHKRDMYSHFYSVVFSPDELRLVKGSPDVRREFLDVDICQVSKVYSDLIDRYDKILQNRNKLLKFGKNSKNLHSELDVWDYQLALTGSQIAKARANFVSKISENAKKVMQKLSQGKESLSIEYIGIKGETREEKTQNFITELGNFRAKDIELGYTSVGVHRDDLKFYINGLEVKPYASQGQQRSVVLALKLAEMETIENESEEPALILDDVFSELDTSRQRLLIDYLSTKQVFITSTNSKNLGDISHSKIRVKNAKILIEN